MLKWKIKNNVISEIISGDKNLINPWGIETADSWAFFSMEENIGYRYSVIDKKINITDSCMTTSFHIKMEEGEWILETEDLITQNKIIRTAKLTCIKESIFMDFVVRFRFKKEFYHSGSIAGKKIIHTSSNIYHQYAVQEASLSGEKNKVSIRILETETCNKFQPHLYIRDHNGEWVVHARMIPTVEDKNVIKLCSRYFKTSPLPETLTNILLGSKKIKDYLWYHSEHSPYKSKVGRFFSPNAFPMIKLNPGQVLFWKVEVEINGQ